MKNNFILNTSTILDGLKQLEATDNGLYTLFVVSDSRTLLGTVTDGDIRRYLISGGKISDTITSAMNVNCKKLYVDDQQFLLSIHNLRNQGVWVIPILDPESHIIDIFNLKTHKSLLPIDVVLMAGGKGERLRPLTERTPKPLVKVGDKCIIDYNIERLISYGVKNINVTVNYLKEQLHAHFNEPFKGVKVNTVEEPKFLGTIGSVQFVKEIKNDYILIMNSDLFTDIDFEDFFLHFSEHDADMSVVAIPYNVSIPFGILNLQGRNIKGLLEKPKYNYYANGGIYLIKKSVLKYIPKNQFFNATDLIEKLISMDKKVIRYPLNRTWIDIGQHADLERAKDLVKHLKLK